jgi:acyl transferase domain-containing protein
VSERAPAEPGYDGSEIAVVGMAGRFPGAPDLDRFWRNLRDGVESITVFSAEDLVRAGEGRERLDDPGYVRARPVLDDVELFDAAFFGFTPREAEVLDPQLRLFLECAWTALEHAGHDPERLPGRASLFAGASFSNYLVHNLYKNRPVMESFGDLQATIYNVQDSLVTMVGYKLNLKGICCAVQTFCSTSLVGVHLACQNLLNYESDLALAGGVSIYVPQGTGYLYEEGSIVSRDGHCRAFDARADGTVFGNGLGVVVLRRLEDARKDGDTVHAVIRGSAVNNDGSLKASFAAPGVVGQTEVVLEALSAADVDPASIGYVEAHGTGTRLGDPAEVSALTKAFRARTDGRGFCALGSVKTNVGHLDAAAGVASLIKVILSLQHGRIPPSLHFERPNPAIDFASSPFYVNGSLREWPRQGGPRRAGVSAFGVGGTNAHVIVEEAPPARAATSDRRPQLLPLSAKTATALEAAAGRLAAHLEAHSQEELADVAYTLQLGRRAFAHRRFVVAGTGAQAAAALRSAGSPTGVCERRNPPVVLLLAAEDEVEVGAWRELYESEETFRAEARRCAEAAGETGRAALEALYPTSGGAPAVPRLVERRLAPVATLVVEYALARLLQSWGLRFEATVGEGVGELVAACLDGRMELASAAGQSVGQARLRGDDREPPARLAPADGRLFLEVESGRVGLRPPDPRPAGETSRTEGAAGGSSVCRTQLLETVGRLWLAGVEVDWTSLHAPERRRRIPLPSYPFERQRFWVEPVEEEEDAKAARAPDSTARLYRPAWKSAMPASVTRTPPASTLVFADSRGLGARIADRLRASGADAVTVRPGPVFGGDPAAGYTLDPGQAPHYAMLWEELRRRGRRPERLIHLWGMEPLDPAASAHERFGRGSQLGFYSLLHLAATRPEGPLAVQMVSTGLHEVIGGEELAPEKAPVVALCRVLGQEEDGLRCAAIDVEPPADDADADRIAERLLEELELSTLEPVVAYRRGRRWVQDYEAIPPAAPAAAGEAAEPRASGLREGGVYLITGGLGNVGFLLGVLLARQARAKLVLTGRAGLPPRDRWQDWLEGNEAAEPTALRIRKVQALETLGAEVLVVAADASRPDEMSAAVLAARERFGALHGVIHAAGELSADTFRPVRELGRESCERQFAPKVYGLLALEAALRDQPIDFCLLTSSLSSVLGGAGYAAYAGANAFMDAFAARMSREPGPRWMSVNWDQWELGRSVQSGARRAAREGATLTAEEGLRAFEGILRLRGLDRVLVSAGPLASRLERWVRLARPAAAAGAADGARHRPALGNAYVAPVSEPERILAGIWQELLGLEAVGVHDNFFELGGHSLFAARVLSRVRAAFGVSLPLDAVFDAPSVAELAARVVAAGGSKDGKHGAEPEARGERVEIEI